MLLLVFLFCKQGTFDNVKRDGLWSFRMHSAPFFTPFDESKPLASWQIHHFKDGLVHGTSLVYDHPQTTWDGSSLGNELFYKRNYQHGKRDGWQYDYQQQGKVVDSVYYEKGVKRD